LQADYKAALQMDKYGGTNHAAEVLKELESVELDERQFALLCAFYEARREAEPDRRASLATLEQVTARIEYEQDLAIAVLKRLDDHLMKLINDKRQKDIDAIKRKGAR
jgi:hypothetical protein